MNSTHGLRGTLQIHTFAIASRFEGLRRIWREIGDTVSRLATNQGLRQGAQVLAGAMMPLRLALARQSSVRTLVTKGVVFLHTAGAFSSAGSSFGSNAFAQFAPKPIGTRSNVTRMNGGVAEVVQPYDLRVGPLPAEALGTDLPRLLVRPTASTEVDPPASVSPTFRIWSEERP